MTSTDDREVQAVRRQLTSLLARLDRLGLHQAGAHLSMAIHCLDDGAIDDASPASPAGPKRRRHTP